MTIQPQIHTRRAYAHRHAVSSDIGAIAATLQKHLGQFLLSVIVGKEPRTLARWVAGTSKPPAASEQLLRDVSQVFDLITTVDTSTVARAWFMGMNPHLDDVSPAESLSEGQTRQVMAAARAYVSGA